MALQVLLVSPVPALDPPSGDVTYTRQLLACPPPGVTYTTYDEAIRDGTLIEVGSRDAVRAARGVDRGLQILSAVARKFEHAVRTSGLTYREPVRVFRVTEDAYDLVHVHVFSHRFLGPHPPVIASAGGPLRWVYGDAWGWSALRLCVADALDSAFGIAWDATLCGRRQGRAELFISPSDYLKTWLLARGWPAERISVQPNYLVPPTLGGSAHAPKASPRTFGFVARDFNAKGGAAVLEAFSVLRAANAGLRLVVAGSSSPATVVPEGVEWLGEIDRAELLDRVLPTIDILLYPSRFDTGVPYSAMEALANGIPAVVTDYRSLPDLVGEGAGVTCRPDDVGSLVEGALGLLVPSQWAQSSAAAAKRFREHFSAATQAPRLGCIYDSVVERSAAGDVRRKRSLRRRNGDSIQR